MSDRLRTKFQRRFILRTLFPVLLAVLSAIAASGAASLYLAHRGDELALHRQEREVRAAVTRNVVKLASEQETVAIWDEPLARMQGKPDLAWLHQNVGAWLNSLFGHDRVYILDGSDRPIYAMSDGRQVAAQDYANAARSLASFVADVRGRTSARNNSFERLPGRAVPSSSQVLTGRRTVHATDLALVAGRPAIVSVMRMATSNGSLKTPSAPGPLLVSIRYLDGDWVEALDRQNLIESARYAGSPRRLDNEAAFPLASDRGVIGYLIWRPERPGSLMQKDLVWVGAALAAAVLMIFALLARALYRSAASNFKGELRLHKMVLELRASKAQAKHLAFHDALTGLPNRALFDDRLRQALGGASCDDRTALLLLDIDRFKHVNDTLGHQAGDALIREFASRVSGTLDSDSTIARLGGDEFAIVVPRVRSNEVLAALCETILEVIRRPFEILSANAFVGTSIGVATAPDFGLEPTELMRKADIALYAAKADGRDCFRVFAVEMDETVQTRSAMEADLRAALAAPGQLKVYYQPEVAALDRPIVGLEALVRWHHPERGLIGPDAFIPVAEETGLIVPLGEWVLRQACRASRRWPDLFIAVNLSPIQFRTAGFAERVIAIVGEEGADPRSIELEITESVLVQNDGEVAAALARLRIAGFRIALDDFGTGYSSLSYLRRFEVDKIKIDRSFVQNLGTLDAGAIVSAVVSLGHAMGLEVTAEGVETDEQSTFLTAAGCNVLQGYFFSRAVPESEIPGLLRRLDLARAA